MQFARVDCAPFKPKRDELSRTALACTNDLRVPRGRRGPAAALVCRALEPLRAHLFTTRPWPLGTADGSRTPAGPTSRARSGVDAAHLERAHQVHGASVVVRRAGDPPRGSAPLPHADIIVSDDPAIVLSIQTADCVPLLIADRRDRRGRGGARRLARPRGARARGRGEALAQAFGSRPADLVAAIGPSISGRATKLAHEVRERFERRRAAAPPQLDRWFVPAEQARALFLRWLGVGAGSAQAAGVPAEQIHLAGLCTASHPDLLCSYRRDGKAGRPHRGADQGSAASSIAAFASRSACGVRSRGRRART